jgi:glycogen operon protein
MATLLLSQGVPMICGGDEIGRTQRGNNNAYCQDNEISWSNWETVDADFLDFCRALIRFRRDHPVFRRRRFFSGRPIFGSGVSDIAWFRPDGAEMTAGDWMVGFAKALSVFLNGETLPDPGPRGQTVQDSTFLLLFNAHYQAVQFVLPRGEWGEPWTEVSRTSDDAPVSGGSTPLSAGNEVAVPARSMLVLRRAEQ